MAVTAAAPRRAAKSLYAALPFKLPLFRLLRHLRPSTRVYQHLHFVGDFRVPVAGGAAFLMHSYGDRLENELFWSGFGGGDYEAWSLRVWERLARTATGTVLDIGANTGAYALAARALNPTVRIVAFEPLTRVMRKLRRNIALNGYQIETVEQAVSDRTGTATINDSADPAGETNVYSASLEQGFGDNRISYDIRTVALDDGLGGDLGAVDLVKLDVELHEPAAIRGMLALLRAHRPAMLVEVLNDAIGAEIGALIAGLDYRCYGIDEAAGLRLLAAPAPIGGESRNVLLCGDAQFARAGLGSLLISDAAA